VKVDPAPPVENPGMVDGTVPRTPLIAYRLYIVELLT